MGIVELVLIAVSLSMDAFAVALCKGLEMRKLNYGHAAIIALFFGGFQGLMPYIGWALGSQFEKYITSVDHWIAFILLSVIGASMIREATRKEDKPLEEDPVLNIGKLFVLAIATSIDALVVGITFAFLHVSILPAVYLIGIITFSLSLAGVAAGNFFGIRYKSKAELAGGIALVLIGLKILLEHLGVL